MLKNLIILLVLTSTLGSCKKEIFITFGEGLEDWSTNTHTPISPNYDVVFDQTRINKIELVFDSEDWTDMQKDLDDIQASSDGGPGGGPGGGGQGGVTFSDETPKYFECDFFFNNKQWYHVGIRYKGNSSLSGTSNKLPFRFQFDQFEDEYPEITNQRFYGFKELSMSSNYNDPALMRDKTAADLFRDFGVPAVQTAFYEIWIDTGNGSSEYYGVYTMTEVVFDSFLASYFGSSTGNCYKPDGDGAAFADFDFNLSDFELKNNLLADKSEIQELFDILHSELRTTEPSIWRSSLETVFDVDGFLKYLAVNNTIQNWDTYGNMTHNYYLYHDPADGLLKWIVWDNNEAFSSGQGTREALSLSMSEISSNWPLISFLIRQPEYEAIYKLHLNDFVNSTFDYNRVSNIYTAQELLLRDSAASERAGYSFVNGINNFTSEVNALRSHCISRITAVNAYL